MADRYWVGGTGNWDAATTTNWSDASGGAGGFSVPTSADNVFFNGSSGAGTVTVTVTANCLNLDFTGFTQTIAVGTQIINVFGNFAASSTMTTTGTFTINFSATTTGFTVAHGGKNLGTTTNFNFDGVGGGWTFTDTVNNGTITLINGDLNTNNQIINAFTFGSSGSGTKSMSLGSSVITLTGGSGGVRPSLDGTNLTITPGTSSIIIPAAASANGARLQSDLNILDYSIANGGTTDLATFATTLTHSVANLILRIGTYNNKTKIVTITNGTTLTATNITILGNRRQFIEVRSSSIGVSATISCSGTANLQYISLRDITGTGGATINARNSQSLGNVTGIEIMSYPANNNRIRPALFTPGRAR